MKKIIKNFIEGITQRKDDFSLDINAEQSEMLEVILGEDFFEMLSQASQLKGIDEKKALDHCINELISQFDNSNYRLHSKSIDIQSIYQRWMGVLNSYGFSLEEKKRILAFYSQLSELSNDQDLSRYYSILTLANIKHFCQLFKIDETWLYHSVGKMTTLTLTGGSGHGAGSPGFYTLQILLDTLLQGKPCELKFVSLGNPLTSDPVTQGQVNKIAIFVGVTEQIEPLEGLTFTKYYRTALLDPLNLKQDRSQLYFLLYALLSIEKTHDINIEFLSDVITSVLAAPQDQLFNPYLNNLPGSENLLQVLKNTDYEGSLGQEIGEIKTIFHEHQMAELLNTILLWPKSADTRYKKIQSLFEHIQIER